MWINDMAYKIPNILIRREISEVGSCCPKNNLLPDFPREKRIFYKLILKLIP